jgi:hypothetical protein
MYQHNIKTALAQLLLCFFIAGCATEVKRHPQTLLPLGVTPHPEKRLITSEVSFKLDSGFDRTLRKDTSWTLVGAIEQGNVFASTDSVFSVEGAHVHEAYLVVNTGMLVGFYLPVERAFSPLNLTSNVNLWEK